MCLSFVRNYQYANVSQVVMSEGEKKNVKLYQIEMNKDGCVKHLVHMGINIMGVFSQHHNYKFWQKKKSRNKKPTCFAQSCAYSTVTLVKFA